MNIKHLLTFVHRCYRRWRWRQRRRWRWRCRTACGRGSYHGSKPCSYFAALKEAPCIGTVASASGVARGAFSYFRIMAHYHSWNAISQQKETHTELLESEEDKEGIAMKGEREGGMGESERQRLIAKCERERAQAESAFFAWMIFRRNVLMCVCVGVCVCGSVCLLEAHLADNTVCVHVCSCVEYACEHCQPFSKPISPIGI